MAIEGCRWVYEAGCEVTCIHLGLRAGCGGLEEGGERYGAGSSCKLIRRAVLLH